jgi:hypothetical protein
VTAYELADLLEQGHYPGGTREQASAMLRQLQDDLSDLQRHIPKKPAKYSDEWWKEVEEFNKQMQVQKK